jgi:TRAP transporter TAXI family solute receptor
MGGRTIRRVTAAMVVVAFGLGGVLAARAATRITLGGGAPGGTYYAVMAAMAKVLEEKSGGRIQPVVETTSGSAHAARLVDSGELTVASVLLDTAARAWTGEGEFKSKLANIRSVMAVIDIGDAFVVRKDSGIMSTRELKGKTIGVPSPAGQLAMAAVLKSHGLGENDYKVRYLSYTAQAAGLQDRNIDAGYMVVHRINSTVTEFMTTTGGRILGFDDAKAVEYFESNYPVWRAVALKAKIYPGQDEEIRVAGRHGLVLASKEVPADLVYDFVKTLFAHPQQLTAIHPAASEISLAQTRQYYDKKLFVVPLHPGAERYLKEAGIVK